MRMPRSLSIISLSFFVIRSRCSRYCFQDSTTTSIRNLFGCKGTRGQGEQGVGHSQKTSSLSTLRQKSTEKHEGPANADPSLGRQRNRLGWFN